MVSQNPVENLLSLKRQRTSEAILATQDFYVPAIDEFGGYSSRLRIPDVKQDQKETKAVLKTVRKSTQVPKPFSVVEDEDG